MATDFGRGEPEERTDGAPTCLPAEATIAVLTDEPRDSELVVDRLDDEYEVRVGTDESLLSSSFDLLIVTARQFEAHRASITERTCEADPAFLPVLLLTANPSVPESVWADVDDVLTTPVGGAEFDARVENLLARAVTSRELAASRRRLSETVAELRVKERAMHEAPVGIIITDPRRTDNPIVYANEAFEQLTGYDRAEVEGRNCRFLQGAETDPDTVARVRAAIDAAESVAVDVLNYRKDGSRFWNHLEIAPVSHGGDLSHFVGFQTDVTQRKIREQRLQVLNRLLTHNLRNHLNIIDGYADLLANHLDDSTLERSVTRIDESAALLQQLSEGVRRIERTMNGITPDPSTRSNCEPVDVASVLEDIGRIVPEIAPGATVTVDVPPGQWLCACEGLPVAVKEAAENAVTHGGDDVHVDFAVNRIDDDRLAVLVTDDGPGIPEHEREVLERETETPLVHSDGLGLWLIYWIVRSCGGDVRIDDPAGGGTRLVLDLPRVDVAQATDGR